MITTVISKLPFIQKQSTIDFYTKLGCEIMSDYGDYIILKLDATELHFFAFTELKPEESDFMIYLRIDKEIETYYKKLQDLNIIIHPNGKLEKKSWNQKEFSVVDPNGTLLTFGQSII